MKRLRLYDCRASRLPQTVGLCTDNVPGIAAFVNSAQRRLLMCKESCDEGWWGTWAEIAFNVSTSQPYITLPREVARLEAMNMCDRPVAIQNQFFEYLQFGNGRLPKLRPNCRCEIEQTYTRNNAVTFTDMTNAPQYITVYITDDRDIGKRVLIQGLDDAENTIYSTDVTEQVTGVFLVLNNPSVQSPSTLSQLNGIQKDVTYGPIRIYQHDPTTGDEILLLTMEPSEQTASYRRYYVQGVPLNCCATNVEGNVQITAIAKLDLIPVATDTDYCLIQNVEAIIEECASIRYADMDSPTAKAMSQERHKLAISFLNGELNHWLGKDQLAVNFAPFGSAHLPKQKIGRLW
jgi:hypothetical protein